MPREITLLLFLSILQSATRAQEFFNTTPQPIRSNFTCAGRVTGYYADIPSNCRVYHNCDDQGNKFSYYCPEMTAFRQEALICDHAHLVDCQAGTRIGKKSLESRKNLDKSTLTTSRTADRWTTANPFRDFLLNTNLTVRDAGKTRFSDVTQDVLGTRSFGFNFGSASSGVRNSQEFGNLRQSTSEQNRTRFFGNTFDRFAKSKEEKIRVDQPTMNSQNPPAWYNRGENFGGRQGTDAKPGDRHVEESVESTTSRLLFGQPMRITTKDYFNFKNSNYPESSEGERKSSRIPRPTTSLKTTTRPTTPSTSDIPLRDFTASLKPLVPNTLEYDPYYPRESWTTTESYYTPVESNKLPRALEAPNFEPSIFGVYFKIPETWPDLNTLDDIVDRRKLFYIPKSDQLL